MHIMHSCRCMDMRVYRCCARVGFVVVYCLPPTKNLAILTPAQKNIINASNPVVGGVEDVLQVVIGWERTPVPCLEHWHLLMLIIHYIHATLQQNPPVTDIVQKIGIALQGGHKMLSIWCSLPCIQQCIFNLIQSSMCASKTLFAGFWAVSGEIILRLLLQKLGKQTNEVFLFVLSAEKWQRHLASYWTLYNIICSALSNTSGKSAANSAAFFHSVIWSFQGQISCQYFYGFNIAEHHCLGGFSANFSWISAHTLRTPSQTTGCFLAFFGSAKEHMPRWDAVAQSPDRILLSLCCQANCSQQLVANHTFAKCWTRLSQVLVAGSLACRPWFFRENEIRSGILAKPNAFVIQHGNLQYRDPRHQAPQSSWS